MCIRDRVYADRGAQVDVEVLGVVGTHVLPPVDEFRLPVLERALQGLVVVEVDVVGAVSYTHLRAPTRPY